jgi:hypothetical protein
VKSFQIQVAAGTVTFRVLRPSEAQAEVDTPSVAVHPLGQGAYRISVRDDGTSEITVRSGEAEIYSPHGSERIGAGRSMYARGPASDPEFQVLGAIAPDSWDGWNDERDQYLLRSRSYEHVSRDVYGAEDLDQYGQWTNDPNYGQVWQPTVAPGWAPYQSGRWVWEDYYGWTWVSYDPWGWAPYHYGRWFWGVGGWCWYPGPVFAHYYWSPAFVGFFGWGGHVGFGFGFGGLGWVPLAPFERFHPWWGRGYYGGFRNGFARNTTIVNNTNITNIYRNARVNGGVTGVNANQFGRGGAQLQTLNHAQIQQAGLVRGAVPVAPGRSSLQVSNRAATGNFPQARTQNFASHMQAPQVNRVPFAQQQQAQQQAISRGNVSAASHSGAGNSSVGSAGAANGGGWQRAVPGNPGVASPRGSGGNSGNAAGSTSGPNSGHGWNRFGEPIHGANGPAPTQSNGGNGWQRFENTRPGGSNGGAAPRSNYYGGGSGQAIRISPPIVQQRAPNYAPPRNYSPSYQAPRSYNPSPSSQAPRSYGGGSNTRSYNSGGGGGSRSSSGGGGGGSRGGGGGGGHASGGGGGHGGGGHR